MRALFTARLQFSNTDSALTKMQKDFTFTITGISHRDNFENSSKLPGKHS